MIALAVGGLCLASLAVSVQRALDWRARVRSLSSAAARGARRGNRVGARARGARALLFMRRCRRSRRRPTCADRAGRHRAGRGRPASHSQTHETNSERHPELIDLEALVLSRVRCWKQIAPGCRSRVRWEWRAGPAWIIGDATVLASALDNLVTNALEHGGGRVLVEGERSGNVVRVLISDGGRGFELASIGEADWTSSRGHGLAIAREAVGAHGGRLVTRARLSGTAIAIELPIANGGAGAPAAPGCFAATGYAPCCQRRVTPPRATVRSAGARHDLRRSLGIDR